MRIAAIYDIHGNLPALEAVLHDIDHSSPDLILVGGDVAAGPLPTATIDRLMTLGSPACFIRGNADRYMVQCFDGIPLDATTPAGARDVVTWAAQQLDRTHRDFLAGFVERATFTVDGLGPVLFCHGSPRYDDEIITAATPDHHVSVALTDVVESVVVCGHTHMQFDREVNGIRVINAGSVGMPYGEPGAYWALLGPEIMLQRTAYDIDRAVSRIRASGYPYAEEFANQTLRHPPTAHEAIEVFERMAQQRAPR
jgi:predicted phosphodiesterase